MAVQAITAVISTTVGLISLMLFLMGYARGAYLMAVVGTQAWRFASEFIRADFRGGGRISAYQIMALAAIPYAVGICLLFDFPSARPDISMGLRLLWSPGIILVCQLLWIGIFLFMGRSQVTGARISFHVRKDRI